MNEHAWIIANAVIGWLAGLYTMYYAIKRANGKRPIRILSASLILWFAMWYSLDLAGVIVITEISATWLRPFLPVFYLIPVWESRAEMVAEGTHK